MDFVNAQLVLLAAIVKSVLEDTVVKNVINKLVIVLIKKIKEVVTIGQELVIVNRVINSKAI